MYNAFDQIDQDHRVKNNLSGHTCRLLLSVLLLLPGWAVAALSQPPEVVITGIEGEQLTNVQSLLNIYQHKDDKGLTQRSLRQLHRGAADEIRAALAPLGYYSPTIDSSLTRVEGSFEARYDITPGPPVIVSSLHFTLDGPGSGNDDLVAHVATFPLKKGAVLHQGRYTRAKKSALKKALFLGYRQAEFSTHELRINRQTRQAEIHLVLATGPRFVFGETRSGQSLLEPEFLSRFFPYVKGEPYAPRKLIGLQQDLNKTNYFSKVTVQAALDDVNGLEIPIDIVLAEPKYYDKYSLGAGYATNTGARATLEWENRLFNSRGHRAKSSLRVAELLSEFNFVYETPLFDPRMDTMLYGFSYDEEKWDGTETKFFSAGLTYEHMGPMFRFGTSLEFHNEDYAVGVTTGSGIFLMPSVSWSLVYADDVLNTENGLFLRLKVKGAQQGIGSDASFLQGRLDGKVVFTPLESWRLLGRLSLGATLVDSIDDLPPSLRFYTGGDQSVRGYGYRELGEQDASGTVVGGRYMAVGSVEVEKLITSRWSVAGFFDTGNAMDDISITLKQGVGLGVRFRLPFGQVRLDLASAISEDGNPVRLHLSVGGDL